MLTVSAIAVLLIRDLTHLGENHTMAVFVNGSPFYTLPGTLPLKPADCTSHEVTKSQPSTQSGEF
jgi:hypothetical protein